MSEIVGSLDKQFSLGDDAVIRWQRDPTNPLPGEAIARLFRGESLLAPEIAFLEAGEAAIAGSDREMAVARVRTWVATHIGTVLEALVALTKDAETLAEPVRGIVTRLQEGLGVLPRAALEDLIAGLDAEGRQALRARKVRLGPLYVHLPVLCKPAAVRLRGLLWSLWHALEIPAILPPDGAVSRSLDPAAINLDLYQAVGYPVLGNRTVRIDMLDRVVSAVYDNAKDGLFRAKHEMAEWLGCSIPDLYAVLEAMGHRKVDEQAQPAAAVAVAVAPEGEAAPVVEEAASTAVEGETAPEGAVVAEAVADGGEAPAVAAVAAPAPQVKPELALFRLRRGKAHQAGGRPPRSASGGAERGARRGGGDRPDRAERTDRPERSGKPSDRDARKPREDRRERSEEGGRGRPKGKPDSRRDDRDRSWKSDRNDRGEGSRFSFSADDSPFAILRQLGKDKS